MKTEIFQKKYPLLSTLVDPNGNNQEYDSNLADQISSQYSSFINSKKKLIPNLLIYFDSKLHDSWVNKITYSNTEVTVNLNEFSTHCFADALSNKYSIRIPHQKRIFPVCFNFSGVKEFTISWINRNGKILPLKKDKCIPRLSEFLYEEATLLELDQISVGFIFWTKFKGNKSYLLMQLTCDNMEILEQQRNAFKTLYGKDQMKLFDTFWSEKQKGKYFDYSTAMEFLNKNQPVALQGNVFRLAPHIPVS